MDKLYKRIQERAFTLLCLLLTSVRAAVGYLRKQIKRIVPRCLKERQRSRMTTLEGLDAQFDQAINANVHPAKKRVA